MLAGRKLPAWRPREIGCLQAAGRLRESALRLLNRGMSMGSLHLLYLSVFFLLIRKPPSISRSYVL